jgi:hypothetical protein
MRPALIASLILAFAATSCTKEEDNDKAVAAPPAAPQPPVTSNGPDRPRAMPVPRLEDMPVDDSAVDNLADMLQRLELAPYHERGFRGQNVKIAVLDNGFTGLTRSLGRRLPPGLAVEPSPRPDMQDTTHGTKLAEIAYALATGSASYKAGLSGPELLLFNANGFTNLKAAIDEVIRRKVDIVLYAQVWEYGGNGDGGGFINREVSRATAAGVLWVNAAGNFGRATYGGPVKVLDDDLTVELPHRSRYLRFTVPQDATPVKIVLSWNDFDESKDYRTPQDLDLVVVDEAGRELGASRLVQAGSAAAAPREGQASAHAREIVAAQLDVGTYRVRVEARTRNFDALSRLRITIDGADVRMVDGTANGSVLIPADNRSVLAVGASDVGYSSQAVLPDGRQKPEISLVSEVRFDDGRTVRGTSAATAIAVGALSVLRSARQRLSYADVMALIGQGQLSTPLQLPPPP